MRGQFDRDHDDRGGNGGRDRVTGSAGQRDGQGAEADERRQRPRVEGQERQVGQAQCEADQRGGHPRQRRGHAPVIAVPHDEHCRDNGPHATQEIVSLGRCVREGEDGCGKPLADQAGEGPQAAVRDGCPDPRPRMMRRALTMRPAACGHSLSRLLREDLITQFRPEVAVLRDSVDALPDVHLKPPDPGNRQSAHGERPG
jgi:hypothetical protein